MKRVLPLIIISCITFVTKGQVQQNSVSQKKIQNYTDTSIKVNNDTSADIINAKTIAPRNKKKFIKKIFSNYQGFDFRNAWVLLSQRQ